MTVALTGVVQTNEDAFCFIIHDHTPYCYEINAILALPRGFRYRNRFATAWVEPNLRDDISKLRGHSVLLVLRDQARNLLIPFRWARIVLAERSGNMFYFEYVVDELILYPTDAKGIDEQIRETTQTFQTYHAWLPGQPMTQLGEREPSVFASRAGAALPKASADTASEWGATVNAVSTAAAYEGSEFLRVLGMRTLDGRDAEVRDEAFTVRPNTVYQVRVLQNIPRPGNSPIKPHEIELHSFSDHFVYLKPTQRAVGKYDLLNFVLKTRSLPPNERSALEIPISPNPSSMDYSPSPLYMPVRVAPRSPALTIAWIAAVMASLFLIFYPKVTTLDEVVVRNIATVFFVLLISGWQRASSALFPTLPWSTK